MGWDRAILTDSGGFQIFSLEGLRKLSEEGVEFRSHIDGSKLFMSPEDCMDIQRVIGSDICMVLDVCTKLPATKAELERALDLTEKWALRSKEQFEKTRDGSFNPGAQLFGIVQGGIDVEMRKRSLEGLRNIGFDGYAVGGLSVGEPFEEACNVLEGIESEMPVERPRYFMGGAKPHDLVEYVKRGIDMFDCVIPTRNARHGNIYRFRHDDLNKPDFFEVVTVTNEKWKHSEDPLVNENLSDIDAELSLYTYGYLRHLFSVNELLGTRLATLMNLRFYLELMKRIRKGIESGEI
jgi:queuine tRNA-ribosyltransferase